MIQKWLRKFQHERALKKFNLDFKWLSHGFSSEEELIERLKNTRRKDFSRQVTAESQRFEMFKNVLATQRVLTDEFLKKYVELAKLDAAPWVTRTAFHNLIQSPLLSERQFDELRENQQFFDDYIKRFVTRKVVTRELKRRELSPENRQMILAQGDDFLQRALLDSKQVHRSDLEVLVKTGVNKAIRNKAKQIRTYAVECVRLLL